MHKGDLPVEISWFHNNRSLVDGNGIIIMKNRKVNSLTIDQVSSEDAGEYTCVATNRAGSASHSATLNVNGILRIFVVLHVYFNEHITFIYLPPKLFLNSWFPDSANIVLLPYMVHKVVLKIRIN